jgi:hypothetical protein
VDGGHPAAVAVRCRHRLLLILWACLLACDRREPTRKPEPSGVFILSPTAGDVWTEGRTYRIRWRADGIDRVNVGVALGGKDMGHLALALPASRDSLEWHIPPGFVSGFGIRRSDQMRVRIEDAGDPARYADSSSFTIVAP